MASAFPLLTAAGLRVQNGWDVVLASDVEAWLQAAPVVYGHLDGDGYACAWGEGVAPDDKESTHTARLLCVEPIVRDTAEGLLRAFIAHRNEYGQWVALDALYDRARKLLAKGGVDE